MYKQYVHVQELQCLYLQEVKGAQIGDPWAIRDPSPPPPHNSGFFKMHKYKECSWHESLLELGKCSPFFVLSGV